MKILLYTILFIFLCACNNKKDEKILFLIKEKDKYGYIDITGTIVIQPIYEKASDFRDGVAIVKYGDKWGVLGSNGKWIINPEYDELDLRTNGTFAIKLGRSWGIADTKGKVVVTPQFDMIDQFTEEGLIKVRLGDKYGYINEKGKYIVNLNFYDADAFSEGLASVMPVNGYNTTCGYIDKKGNTIVQPQFQEAYHFIQGLALVKMSGKYGFIDKKGSFVINPQFDAAFFFLGDIAPVVFNWKIGFINKKGEYVIQPVYDDYDIGLNGLINKQNKSSLRKILNSVKFIKVKKDGKWGIVDLTGKEIVPVIYDYISSVENGQFVFRKDKKFGIMDVQNKEIVPNTYADINNFNEGLSVVAQELEKEVVETYNTWDGSVTHTVKRTMKFYGFIDQSNKTVIEYQYIFAYDFNNGLARVALEKKDLSYDYDGYINGIKNWAYIDKAGKQIWPKSIDQKKELSNK